MTKKKPESEKLKTGAPTKYRKEYCVQAAKLCKLGAIDKDIADFFEVSLATVNNWKNDFPELLDALKASKRYADQNVKNALYKRATGFVTQEEKDESGSAGSKTTITTKEVSPDTTACIFWLKNRQPEEWRDKPEDDGESEQPIGRIKIEVVGANSNNKADS